MSWGCRIVFAVTAAGCGRLGFAEVSPGAGDGALAADTPPVPAMVCGVQRQAISDIPAVADLAVTATPEGMTALWVATGGGPLFGAQLDGQLAPIGAARQMPKSGNAIGGVADAGVSLVAIVVDVGEQTVYGVSRDLATWTPRQSLVGAVTGRDPFISEVSLATHVLLNRTAVTNDLKMTIVQPDGTLGVGNAFATASPITEIAGDAGPDHGHSVWTEDIGGGMSRCTASDIDYSIPVQMGSMQVISDDCHQIRNASGPPPADSMIIVWTTSGGSVEARYIAQTGDLPRQISPAGRAPKVRFDGAQFWIAWIDQRGATDELHLAMFDLAGVVTDIPLPGWKPVGDEAFEIVRSGARVYLAFLDADALTFMRLCP